VAALSGLPGLSPTPRTIREMDKLPFVKGNLLLCLGVWHPTQTPDVVLFETTHTPVPGFTLNEHLTPGAPWGPEDVVDN